MLWTILFSAIALVFVFEGVMPFLCPDCWRKLIKKLGSQSDKVIRLTGLFSLIFGVVLLFIVHHHLL